MGTTAEVLARQLFWPPYRSYQLAKPKRPGLAWGLSQSHQSHSYAITTWNEFLVTWVLGRSGSSFAMLLCI